jgi:RNA polymerase sigma-70 factor (ECF subfamily)
MADVAVFLEYRSLLLGVAYRMLGSASEAEDIVQEAYLRWAAIPDGTADNPRAYLTTTVVRLCLDQLRSARSRRENYVGEWLPEPVTADPLEDGAAAVELADSLSLAFLVMLEELTPLERAAFLLREVFQFDYDEVGAMLGRSPQACRQLVARGKRHVAERRIRFDADQRHSQQVATSFMTAVTTGDLQGVLSLLAEDVVVHSDGGGKVTASRRPVYGRDKAARFLLGISRKRPAGTSLRETTINGQPGAVITVDGQVFGVVSLDIVSGVIAGVRIVVNPDKLSAVHV